MRMSLHFIYPNGPSGGYVKVELDLSSYATKANLKEAADTDASMLASKNIR